MKLSATAGRGKPEQDSNLGIIDEDSNDDKKLRTEYGAKAKHIVSGDGHLLSLREFRGIKIVTINEMLELTTLPQ